MKRGERERLPSKRHGPIYELVINTSEGRRKLYVILGLYPDGRVGEIFLKTAKDGSEMRTSLGTFAMAISLALQHGLPIHRVAHTFRGVRSHHGTLRCPGVPELDGQPCGSLWDAVARLIDTEVDQEGYHRDSRDEGPPVDAPPVDAPYEEVGELSDSGVVLSEPDPAGCPCGGSGWLEDDRPCPDHPPSEETRPLKESA